MWFGKIRGPEEAIKRTCFGELVVQEIVNVPEMPFFPFRWQHRWSRAFGPQKTFQLGGIQLAPSA
jgi:hypothetical protein